MQAGRQAGSLTGPACETAEWQKTWIQSHWDRYLFLGRGRGADGAPLTCMKNVPPGSGTPTYKESLSITNQEGGSFAGTDVRINGQENGFIRSA